jgi:hypothetical protein
MNRTLLLIAVGLVLSTCSSSARQSTIQPLPVAKRVSKATAGLAPKPKLTFIKLDPRLRFVVKKLQIERDAYRDAEFDKDLEERILFHAEFGYQGPKPVWWGKRPQLFRLRFITDTGKAYEAVDVRQGEDYFGSHGLCVL